jgi:nucleotide-binding universal stress UspA family protein
MYKSIVVTLDGSKFAEQALPHARACAKAFHSECLYLLAVIPATEFQPIVTAEIYPVFVSDEFVESQQALVNEFEQSLNTYLNSVVNDLAKEGIAAIPVIRHGNAADEILAFAREKNVDLIVMSTHGRSGLSRWVYGSIADKVLRGAHLPVLLIRAQENKEHEQPK